MEQQINFAQAQTCLLMEPQHSNILGHVHGGELMKMMDNTAGIASAKQAKGMVVTARVDEIEFHEAVKIGDVVTVQAQVCYVGKSSIQVFVRVFVDNIQDNIPSIMALSAFFTMVHLVDGKPSKVEPLNVTNPLEQELFDMGYKKYIEIQQKRQK